MVDPDLPEFGIWGCMVCDALSTNFAEIAIFATCLLIRWAVLVASLVDFTPTANAMFTVWTEYRGVGRNFAGGFLTHARACKIAKPRPLCVYLPS